MPILYGSTGSPTIGSSLSNAGQIVQFANNFGSGVPSGGTPSGISGDSLAAYTMSPDEVTSRFTGAYQDAYKGFGDYPGAPTEMDKLRDLYSQVPSTYDVSGTLAKMQASRRANLNVGEAAANTTAQQFRATQQPGRTSDLGAGVLRGQALLPYLKEDYAGAKEEGQYGDSAKQSALTASANIAKTLSELQQSYLSSLASYNSNRASTSLDYANKLAGLALNSSQQNQSTYLDYVTKMAQIAENARQANLSAAISTRNQDLQNSQAQTSAKITAAQSTLASKAPTGSWVTDALGRVISGQGSYQTYKDYEASRNSALATLGRI